MDRLKSLICEMAVIVIILFLVLVAGLVDIRDDQSSNTSSREIQEMNASIEKDKKNIENMSDGLVKKNKELEQIKKNMDKLKSDNNITELNNSIIIYNTKLLEYKSSLTEYNISLDKYNKRCAQFKILGEKNKSLMQWIKSIVGI